MLFKDTTGNSIDRRGSDSRLAAVLLFLATLCVGLGYVMITPVFEGFDETAHYSRILSTAYVSQPLSRSDPKPSAPVDRISQEIDDYQKIAPMPLGWLRVPVPMSEAESHATPDYDMFVIPSVHAIRPARDDSYEAFFADPVRVSTYIEKFRTRSAANGYEPGLEPAWEYQHPPLYYYLLAPFAKLAAGTSLVDRVIFLRMINYILVMMGLWFALRVTFLKSSAVSVFGEPETASYGMIFPFIAPSFWGEFCRLGNDNLCALFFAIAWFFLLKHLSEPRAMRFKLALALFLGFGCLVKFTMVAAAGGVLLFLAAHHLIGEKKTRSEFVRAFVSVSFIGLVTLLIGSGWYVFDHIYGFGQGSVELTWMVHDTHLLERARSNISMSAMIEGVVLVFTSAIYLYNSNSAAVVELLNVTLSALAFGICVAYLSSLKSARVGGNKTLPLWVIGPPFLMLILHVAYSVVELGYQITSGRYLLVVLPAFIAATGLGLNHIRQKNGDLKMVAAGALVSAPIVNLYLFFYSVSIYGGCARPISGSVGGYTLGPRLCLDQLAPVMKNLSVLSWPILGCIFFVVGWLSLVASVLVLWRKEARQTERISKA